MGDNIVGKNESDCALGQQKAYRTGKDHGYHLGYNFGFESGFEKGYIEGSTLGYNNGFLAALRLGEGAEILNAPCANIPNDIVYKAIKKLIEGGQLKILLSGCATREAEILFKLISLNVHVIEKE
ncbi:MAG: hypothetical protein A4E55_00728 [Pelotomaculum sp. PtaU1.Bin035]|nr:MAG: hypothetical protein A4E55_00728 [Pelotomaculum sp. PtaU1.Bin035]